MFIIFFADSGCVLMTRPLTSYTPSAKAGGHNILREPIDSRVNLLKPHDNLLNTLLSCYILPTGSHVTKLFSSVNFILLFLLIIHPKYLITAANIP